MVLRRYAKGRSKADVDYELKVLDRLQQAGWAVASAETDSLQHGEYVWCAFRYCPGRSRTPRTPEGIRSEQRARGRLLAELHQDTTRFVDLGQRDGWERLEEVLQERTTGPSLEQLLQGFAKTHPEEASIFRWHAKRARNIFQELRAQDLPGIVIHGDFAPWNIRYKNGKLSGIFDFDLCHLNHRVADFALSWRGKHDDVIHGYQEVHPLNETDLALLTPAWWTWVLWGVKEDLQKPSSAVDMSWNVTHILRRSPLMPSDLQETPARY